MCIECLGSDPSLREATVDGLDAVGVDHVPVRTAHSRLHQRERHAAGVDDLALFPGVIAPVGKVGAEERSEPDGMPAADDVMFRHLPGVEDVVAEGLHPPESVGVQWLVPCMV